MKRVAVLFCGQGSQYVGMGRRLFEREPQVQQMFARAGEVLDLDLRKLCFDGPAEQLNSTENTQPALLLCAVADYRVWRARTGLTPAYMAGHSLGELSALVAAGALSLEDGLQLARERGLAMSRCTAPGAAGMAAVTQLDTEQVLQACRGLAGFGSEFVLANDNSPQQCVLSGDLAALRRAGETLKALGASVIELKVSGPFHSPYMAEAGRVIGEQLCRMALTRPGVPVISNADVRPHGEPADIVASLKRQLVSPVRWRETLAWLQAQSVDVFLETGPRSVLKRLALANVPGATAYALDDADDQAAIDHEFAAELRGMRERPSLISKCLAVAVCTRNHNWDESEYQQGVVEPYRALQALQEQLESQGRTASESEMRTALTLLDRIFATKRTPAEERSWRMDQILEITGTRPLLGDGAPAALN
jgi:[acyl-carrier-protein] S-malonyltransferase